MSSRRLLALGLGLGLATAGCSTMSTPEIRELGRRGETARLIEIWPEAENDERRITILEALADHPVPEGRAFTAKQVRTAHSVELRRGAVGALARYPDADVADTLIVMLGDPAPQVREEAQLALAERGPSADRVLLKAAAKGEDPLARAASAALVSAAARRRSAIRTEVQELLEWLVANDTSPRVREEAARGLGMLRVSGARKLLLGRTRLEDDPAARQAAERALAELDTPAPMVCAVVPLWNTARSRDTDRIAIEIVSEIRRRLSSDRVCEVLDPQKVDRILQRLDQDGGALFDDNRLRTSELHRFHMADQLLFGSIKRDRLVYTIRLDRLNIDAQAPAPGAETIVRGYAMDLERMKQDAIEGALSSFR